VAASFSTQRTAYTVALVGACAVIFFFGVREQRIASVAFFSDALKAAHTDETVAADGISYRVEDGSVTKNGIAVNGTAALPPLELAYALTLARRSPVFGLEGDDPAQLDAAVSNLVSAQQGLAKLQHTSTSSALVLSSLYPIDFLRALAALEQSRQSFLHSGSDTDLSAYIDAQRATLAAYEKNLRSFRSAFEQAVPADVAEYGTTAGVVDRNSSLASLDGLGNMATDDTKLLERRELCLSGSTAFCNADELALPTLPDVSPLRQASSPAFLKNVLSIYTDASDKGPVQQVVELAQGTCVRDVDAPPIYALYASGNPAIPLPWLTFAGDILVIRAAQYPDIPYYQYYLAHDVSYVAWRPSTHYTCPDFDTDFGAVFAVQAAEQAAAQHPFSALASKGSSSQLARLEAALVSPKDGTVRETDARAYVSLARRMIDAGTLSSEASDAVASLSLLLQNKSGGFVDMVSRMASIEKINTGILAKGTPVELGTPYLFYVRSAFFSLFLGAQESPAAYRSPVDPAIALTSAELPLLHYSQQPDITRAELVKDMRFFFTLHGVE